MRTRPIRVFSAAFVIVGGGCGELWNGPPDDAAPTIIDSWSYATENPPPPDTGPDGPPPACLLDFSGNCNECVPREDRSPSSSLCAATVCAIDATCCTTLWDERCIDLADARCPTARCIDTIGVGGNASFGSARWDGIQLVPVGPTPFGRGHVFSVAWSGTQLAYADYDESAPGGAMTGRRVRFGDVGAVRSGGHGATDVGGTIVPYVDGYIGDFVLADLEPDGDLDLLVAFLDGHGLRRYRKTGSAWVGDNVPIGPDAHTLELCDVDGDGARDLVLVDETSLSVHAFADGLGAALFPEVAGSYEEAACGDLDDDGKDEIVVTEHGGPVRIIDHTGAIVWTAAETLTGSGVDTGDLDGDGDVDLVISEWGADAHVHVYWNRGEAPLAFDHLLGPVLGDDLGRLDLTRLGPPT